MTQVRARSQDGNREAAKKAAAGRAAAANAPAQAPAGGLMVGPEGLGTLDVVRLQRIVGNTAVQRMLSDGRGAKPAQADDPLLGEVQRLIGRLGISNAIQRKGAAGSPGARPLLTTAVGGNNPDATKELQTKVNAANVAIPADNPAKATLPLAVDGIFGPKTKTGVMAFQKEYGLVVDGKVGTNTWAALDAEVKQRDEYYTENVGGVQYGATAKYDWRVTPQQVHVTVKINFTGADKPDAVERWFQSIRSTWNRFKAVNTATGEELAIVFEPQKAAGHHNVQVIDALGRSNAAQWYTQDSNGVADNNRMAAHEFGHLIGLRDEYQLTHGDYKAYTGEEPPKGETTGDAKPADIAKEIKKALAHKTSKNRVSKMKTVISSHKLKQGEFSQKVLAAYNKDTAGDLLSDLVKKIPGQHQWGIIDPFTYSNATIMGNFYLVAADKHTHPVLPRHMATFVDYAKQAKGGTWEAK